MVYNHVFLVPSPDTKAYFARQFSGCPFAVHVDQFRVSLAISPDTLDPSFLEDFVFVAEAGSMRLYPNPSMGGSSLILPLVAPSMQSANAALLESARPAYDLIYSPHLTIVEQMPPLKRYIKAWVNSLSAVFRNEPIYFEFMNPTLEAVDFPYPPDEYYLREQEAIVQHLSK